MLLCIVASISFTPGGNNQVKIAAVSLHLCCSVDVKICRRHWDFSFCLVNLETLIGFFPSERYICLLLLMDCYGFYFRLWFFLFRGFEYSRHFDFLLWKLVFHGFVLPLLLKKPQPQLPSPKANPCTPSPTNLEKPQGFSGNFSEKYTQNEGQRNKIGLFEQV